MNSTNCSEFGEGQKTVLVSITVTVAGISFLCCLGVVLLIILFKKYLFFTQRLTMYLVIAAMLSSLVRCMNIHHPSITLDSQGVYCMVTGFLDQYMSSCFLLAIAVFTIDISLQAIFSLNTKKVEVLYPILIFLLPSLYCWVPFAYDAFGVAGPWCWIRTMKEYNNCERFMEGFSLALGLFYVPYFTVLSTLLILVLAMLYVLYLRRHDYVAAVDSLTARNRTTLRRELRVLILYPMLIIVLNIIPLATRLHDFVRPDNTHDDIAFALWIVNSVVAPSEGIFIALVFIIDPETRKRMTFSQVKAALLEVCSMHSHGQVTEYPAEIKISTDSYTTTVDRTNKSTSFKQSLLSEHRSYDSTM